MSRNDVEEIFDAFMRIHGEELRRGERSITTSLSTNDSHIREMLGEIGPFEQLDEAGKDQVIAKVRRVLPRSIGTNPSVKR